MISIMESPLFLRVNLHNVDAEAKEDCYPLKQWELAFLLLNKPVTFGQW